MGKSKITNGRGSFTGAVSVNELLGTYASVRMRVEVQQRAGDDQGDISLALSGTGKGWDWAWTAPLHHQPALRRVGSAVPQLMRM